MRSTIVANVVMLGAFASATNLVATEAMKKAILSSVPKGTEKLNLASFDEGYERGKKLLGKREIR
jgi:2-oxoglutarate ferredoxin oxidoreductase subunit gamma